MNSKAKGKYKILGIFLGYFILFSLCFAFVIYPIIRGIVYNSDEIQKKIIDNEINQAGIGKIPEMENVHHLFLQKQDTMNVIIKENEEVDFIKSMEGLAEETGNKIEIKINEDKKNTASNKVDDKKIKESIIGSLPYSNYVLMDITLEGSYESFVKFLNKLEKFGKYSNVVGFNLVKNEEESTQDSKNVFDSMGNIKNSQETKKKEILKSVINLAVYVRK